MSKMVAIHPHRFSNIVSVSLNLTCIKIFVSLRFAWFCSVIMASKVLDLNWKPSKLWSHQQASRRPLICLHEVSSSLHLMCCLLLWLLSPMESQQSNLPEVRFHGWLHLPLLAEHLGEPAKSTHNLSCLPLSLRDGLNPKPARISGYAS